MPSILHWRACAAAAAALIVMGIGFRLKGADETGAGSASGANCTFTANPDRFLQQQSRMRRNLYQQTQALNKHLQAAGVPARPAADINSIPHRNFIDDFVFGALAAQNIAPAALSTDEEFFRRINLDLAGQLPA